MLQNLLEPTVEDGADRGVRARVLNATSGSAASANATAAAAIIATERDAELIVVHVQAPEVMRVGRLAPTIIHQQRLRDPHANGVLSAARQVAWAHGAFARVILLSGDPGPAIVSLARDLHVELVVIGATPSRAPALKETCNARPRSSMLSAVRPSRRYRSSCSGRPRSSSMHPARIIGSSAPAGFVMGSTRHRRRSTRQSSLIVCSTPRPARSRGLP